MMMLWRQRVKSPWRYRSIRPWKTAGSYGPRCAQRAFDLDKLNAEFFPDGRWKVNVLCNLGYGDQTKLYPRNPRLNFEEASLDSVEVKTRQFYALFGVLDVPHLSRRTK